MPAFGREEAFMRKTLIPVLIFGSAVLAIVALEATGPLSPPTPEPTSDVRGTEPPITREGGATEPSVVSYTPADLFSDDPERALAAAAALDPGGLNLAELRRQQSILVEHPAVYFGSRGAWGIGSVELPRLFIRTAEEGLVYLDAKGRERLIDTHRVWLPSSMDFLVEALGRSGPDTFPHFLDYLNHVSGVSGDGREAAAHGLLYAIERLYREARGEPLPTLADFYVGRPDHGLPDAFARLARFVWLDPKAAEVLGKQAGYLPSPIFLLRWAHDLEPVPADIPFLVDLARRGSLKEARGWAVSALGKLDGASAELVIRDLAKGDDRVAALAAAALARRGEPGRLRELIAAGELGDLAGALRMKLFPEDEVTALADYMKAALTPDEDGEMPWAPLTSFWPDQSDRADLDAWWGVSVTAEDLDTLAAVVLDAPTSVTDLEIFYGGIHPDALRGPAIDKFIAALREFEPGEEMYSPWGEMDVFARTLAPLEVRAPKKLNALLAHWVREGPESARVSALHLLAQLGDDRFVPEMLDLWRELAGESDQWWGDSRPPIGRIRDPRVLAFLEEAIRTGDGEHAGAAIRALAEYHGLPPDVALAFFNFEDLPSGPVEKEAVELLLSGDAVAAALHLERESGVDLAVLGLVDDPRVRELLTRRRTDRVSPEPDVGYVYWEATAALAMLGDPEARAEVVGAIRDGRTWIIEQFDAHALPTLGGDPELVEIWLSRIDSNCCHGLLALWSLCMTYPLLDIDYDLSNMAEVRAITERWYARHRGRFAWSRLANGWVPR